MEKAGPLPRQPEQHDDRRRQLTPTINAEKSGAAYWPSTAATRSSNMSKSIGLVR